MHQSICFFSRSFCLNGRSECLGYVTATSTCDELRTDDDDGSNCNQRMSAKPQRVGFALPEIFSNGGLMNHAQRSNPARLELLREGDLVELAQRGNAAAFEELISRARESCVRIATVILRDSGDAEDEVQNAFWKAYTHLSLFNRQSLFSTWVTRIVINHCLMRYRRARRLRFVPFEIGGKGGTTFTIHEPEEGETPELGVGRGELSEIVRDELGKLPLLLRTPLEMRYFQ